MDGRGKILHWKAGSKYLGPEASEWRKSLITQSIIKIYLPANVIWKRAGYLKKKKKKKKNLVRG